MNSLIGKEWSDDHLPNFKTKRYRTLSTIEISRLVKVFELCLWNLEFNIKELNGLNIVVITEAMASQLMTSEYEPCLVDERDSHLEEFEYPYFLSKRNLSDQKFEEILPQMNESGHNLTNYRQVLWRNWMEQLSTLQKTAILAFIANVCLQACDKSSKYISQYFEFQLTSDLKNYYSKCFDQVSSTFNLPSPDKVSLFRLRSSLQYDINLQRNFIATCLDVYLFERKLENHPRTTIISGSFLINTACHGLGLIVFMLKDLGLENQELKAKFERCLRVLANNTFAELSECRISYFLEKYDVRWEKKPILGSENVLWPWARLLDESYFYNLSKLRNQTFVARILAFLNSVSEKKEWNSIGYRNMSPTIIQDAEDWYKSYDWDVEPELSSNAGEILIKILNYRRIE